MPAADLYAIPFATLVDRLDRELASGGPVYHLARRDWWTPGDVDVGIEHLGHRLATPAGPASGPHTQLAQNLVLSFLSGGRFMELKTVQENDALDIPRPCIHVPHIGYNVEWSQELRVAQSAEEYVKGWMLMHMLCSEHGPGLWDSPDCVYDISIGYDLAGIRSQKVRGYLDVLQDASALIEGLRGELPARLARWGEVAVPTRVADSVTLSTFHGCPANEIEAIAEQTLDWGLHTVVKLNPTLLGHDRVRSLLDNMGYDAVAIWPEAFDNDLQWSELEAMVPRLRRKAQGLGLGFGVKFTNTLVCRSAEAPFPQDEMYLSGPPLHVLAVTLAAQFRRAFPGVPITFSAGVDRANFKELVGAGIGPVTSCSDLLKGKGYARMTKYLRDLENDMVAQDCADVVAYRSVLGDGELDRVAAAAPDDARYGRAANDRPPKKVGSHLELLDCLTCDKCIPVCPNAANFTVELPQGTHNPGRVRWGDGELEHSEGQELIVAKRHQIGNTAEACNLCGQCDVWCPEDGGPYIVKPTLFVTRQAFEDHPERDGFWVDRGTRIIEWRRGGQVFRYGQGRLELPGGALRLNGDQVVGSEGSGEVDLRVAVTMRLFLDAFCEEGAEVFVAR